LSNEGVMSSACGLMDGESWLTTFDERERGVFLESSLSLEDVEKWREGIRVNPWSDTSILSLASAEMSYFIWLNMLTFNGFRR